MKDSFTAAFRYSIPVLLGYMAIGVAFGLMLAGAGYPWWLAMVMSLWMYAGAGQYIAVGLFAAGTTLWEACLIQLVVNARHIAYAFSMFTRFKDQGPAKPYLVFSLTDETFALLSSLPEDSMDKDTRRRFMFRVALLDHCYWVCGSVLGAVAGTFIPFDMSGIGFALTALFLVLMMEQIKRVKKPDVFLVSGAAALFGVFFLPARISLLAAMVLALVLSAFAAGRSRESKTLTRRAKPCGLSLPWARLFYCAGLFLSCFFSGAGGKPMRPPAGESFLSSWKKPCRPRP